MWHKRWKLVATLLTGASLLPVSGIAAGRKKALSKRQSTPVLNASSNVAVPKTVLSGSNDGSMDSTGLTRIPQETESSSEASSESGKRSKFKRSEVPPTGLLTSDTKEILSTVKGINFLLAKSPSENDRVKLQLNRAMATYSMARRRLIEAKGMQLDDTGKKLLNISVRDSEAVIKTPNITKTFLARAYYIRGLASIYLDQSRQARASFMKALEVEPKSDNAGWMALYIAEDMFDSEQYREAIPFYTNYLPRMDSQQSELSRYKMAWAYVNLENAPRAKKIFIDLIRANPKEGFGRDSIKDLAFLVTTYNSEEEIIRISSGVFKGMDVQPQIDFLASVLVNLESQNAVTLHSKVLGRLLQIEKDPAKKLEYLVAGIRTSRREYASNAHFSSFMKIKGFVESEGLEPGSSSFEPAKASLDLEAQNIIKSYVDTFSGRTKTPEKIPKEEIGRSLKVLFLFYDKYFKESKAYPSVVKLWLQLGVETNDPRSVDAVAEKILARKDMQDTHHRAAIEQLVALEKMANAPGGKTSEKAAADKKLVNRLQKFVEDRANSPSWIDVAKRLVEYLVRDKKFDDALALMDKVFEKEKSADSFYRLQWSRYEAGKFEDVVKDTREPTDRHDIRTSDLKREASLKLAVAARKKDQFQDYSTHIRTFLSLNPSPDKALAARKDFFLYMLEKNLVADLDAELLQLTEPMRFSPGLSDILEQAWVRSMRSGRFTEAASLVTALQLKKLPPQLNSRRFIANLSAGKRPGVGEFYHLAIESRDYILGTLDLAQPDWALTYLMSIAPLKSKELIALGALALRLSTGQWNIAPTQKAVMLLTPSFPFSEVENTNLLPSEKLIAKVKIPSGQIKNQNTLARWTSDIIYQIKLVRSKLPRDIAKKPIAVQIRAVRSAHDLELKVADFIRNQPIPAGLSGTQIDEYEKGIAEVVKEYTDQAAEFEKLAISLEARRDKMQAEVDARQLPLPDIGVWPWPALYNSEEMASLRTQIENHNYLGALFVLDLFRPDPLKSDVDYSKIRSGILFSIKDSASLRRYVLEELEQTKQSEVIGIWKNLVQGQHSETPSEDKPNAAVAPGVEKGSEKEKSGDDDSGA